MTQLTRADQPLASYLCLSTVTAPQQRQPHLSHRAAAVCRPARAMLLLTRCQRLTAFLRDQAAAAA